MQFTRIVLEGLSQQHVETLTIPYVCMLVSVCVYVGVCVCVSICLYLYVTEIQLPWSQLPTWSHLTEGDFARALPYRIQKHMVGSLYFIEWRVEIHGLGSIIITSMQRPEMLRDELLEIC